MIRSILLENFMSHTYSYIKLDNKLNVIIGKNDVGKSAVLHGLRWFFINEPRGTNFITVGKAFSRVSLDIGDSITLIKERTANTTKFMLKSFDDIVDTYHKTEIPEEFLELLEIKVVTKFGSFSAELNFIFQHDSYFMISDSGSVGAQVLGKIAGTDPIDYANKKLKKESFGINNMLKFHKQEMVDLEDKIEEYNYITKLKERYEELNAVVEGLKNKSIVLSKLKELSRKYSTIVVELEEATKEYGKYKNIKAVEDRLLISSADDDRLRTIRILHSDFINIDWSIKSAKTGLLNLDGLEDVAKTLNAADYQAVRRKSIFDTFTIFVDISKIIRDTNKQYKTYDNLIQCVDKFNEVNNSYTKFTLIKICNSKYLRFINDKEIVENRLKTYINGIDISIDTVVNKRDFYYKLLDLNSTYNSVISSFNISKDMLETTNKTIEKESLEIKNLFKELKVCPLCEQKIVM